MLLNLFWNDLSENLNSAVMNDFMMIEKYNKRPSKNCNCQKVRKNDSPSRIIAFLTERIVNFL